MILSGLRNVGSSTCTLVFLPTVGSRRALSGPGRQMIRCVQVAEVGHLQTTSSWYDKSRLQVFTVSGLTSPVPYRSCLDSFLTGFQKFPTQKKVAKNEEEAVGEVRAEEEEEAWSGRERAE
nr:hypothetical protein Iba_chr05fCG8620 [Ipomoea batatas]